MTGKRSPLFELNVWLENQGQPEWPDAHHLLYLDPPYEDNSDYSRADQLTAARWRIGVAARVALQLQWEMREAQTARSHGCASMYGRPEWDGFHCGLLIVRDVIEQVWHDPGGVGIAVPDEEAAEWAARARELAGQVITTDLAAPPVEPGHGTTVTLTDITAPSPQRTNA